MTREQKEQHFATQLEEAFRKKHGRIITVTVLDDHTCNVSYKASAEIPLSGLHRRWIEAYRDGFTAGAKARPTE